MHVAETLLNKSEELVFRELTSIASDNALRLFAKPRLSDVIVKDRRLMQREFDFYTRAHVDFVLADATTKPIMIIEYDGPFHETAYQQERDQIKDALCVEADLGILRINANHVTRLYRGITVLRWVVEVSELQRWFDKAQADGRVPYDEPFDPAMISDDGSGRKWPYWLSASTTQAINSFMRKLARDIPKGSAGIIGTDQAGNGHRLSFLWFGDRLLWAKTAVRKQHIDFPSYDLLQELATCELGIKLSKFRRGELEAISINRFQHIHDEFCDKFNAHINHSWGYPFEYNWGSVFATQAG